MYRCVDIYVDVPNDMPKRGSIFAATCFIFTVSLSLYFVLFFEIANKNCKKWNWYFRTKLLLTRLEPSNNSFCLSNFIFATPLMPVPASSSLHTGRQLAERPEKWNVSARWTGNCLPWFQNDVISRARAIQFPANGNARRSARPL